MVPKESGFNQSETASGLCARIVLHARLPWQGMVKLYKGSILVIAKTQFAYPKSGYISTKLHGTSTCGCNNNVTFSDRTVDVCRPR